MPLGKGDQQPRRHLGAGTRVWVEGIGVADLLGYVYKNAMTGEPIAAQVYDLHQDIYTDVPWERVWELIYRVEEEP